MSLNKNVSYVFSPGLGDLQPSLTLGLTQKAKELIGQGVDVLSLCAGEPDFDTPEHVKQAAADALMAGDTKYTPSSGRMDLRQAIANKFNRENGISCAPQQVIVSPGAKFSVFAAVAVLCRPGDEVLIPSPYWLSYPEMVKAAGGVPVFVPTLAEDGFCPSVEQMEKQVTERTRILILNSPSNPTGGVYSRKQIEQIAEFALRRNLLVISDEIYEKLIYEGKHISIASLSEEAKKRTILINGVSKAYAMTGWRLGYAAAPDFLTHAMDALQSHSTSGPNSFAQKGAVAALKGSQQCVTDMRDEFNIRREYMYERLAAIPNVSAVKPLGAFYMLADISKFGLSSTNFADRLLSKAEVAVVPGIAFGDDKTVRLSYATDLETIKTGLDRIEQFCRTI